MKGIHFHVIPPLHTANIGPSMGHNLSGAGSVEVEYTLMPDGSPGFLFVAKNVSKLPVGEILRRVPWWRQSHVQW
jgi:hypothetical protein